MPGPKDQNARSRIAKIGAHESWAATPDRTARTAPGRAAFEAKFLEQADGDPKRAASLRKAYYLRLAHKSVAARAKNRRQTENAQLAAELREVADKLEVDEFEADSV